MGTYLTNSKMSPELRARIEASVTGRRGPRGALMTPRVRALFQLVVVVVVAGAVAAFVHKWRQSTHELDLAKAALLADMDRLQTARPTRDQPLVPAAERCLTEAAGTPGEDQVDPSLREPAALKAALERPLVYLRAPVSAVDVPSWLARLDPDPAMDAFVACLMVPPAGRAEGDLVTQVEAAYRGGLDQAEETARAYRLQIAVAAQPFFEDSWHKLVNDARTVSAVAELRQAMEVAQLQRATEVERAELLLYLLDEPKTPGSISELDGASAHVIRVGLFDLAASRPLLSLRREVDPQWISKAKRVYLARGLNACRLAYDLREELRATGENR